MITSGLLKFTIFSNIILWGVNIPFIGNIIGINFFVVLLSAIINFKQSTKIALEPILIWITFIIYALSAYTLGPCSDTGLKSFFSLAGFSIELLCCVIIARSLLEKNVCWTVENSVSLLKFITVAAGVGFLAMVFHGSEPASSRSGGIFLEPSHLALSSVPLLIHMVLSNKKHIKLLAMLFSALLLLFSYSSTFLFLLLILMLPVILGILARNPFSHRAIFTVVTLLLLSLVVSTQPKFEETLLRFNDTIDLSESSNLSSLVYANGWQLLEKNLYNTSGFGLGFNAMGCNPRPFTRVSQWLFTLNLEDQNYNDGSFMLSKMGSEFGYLGILFLIVMALISFISLFIYGKRGSSSPDIIYLIWFSTFSFSAFLRNGGGYFAGPMVLFILSTIILFSQQLSGGKIKP